MTASTAPTESATPDLNALLDAMTLEEQVSLLTGADFWTSVAIPRLGVPAFKVTDGPNGARGGIFKDGPRTACFPVGIALGSTWNPALVQDMGAALATETKLKGAQMLLGPTINLQRTVYNGRNFECYSEDPWLSAELAVAYVKGLQGGGVAATLKHYAGNESEYQRMTVNSRIGERALRELYLLPFERAVKEAAAMGVMTGYNHLNGPWAADSGWLITQVLRQEWGFDGLVMTDWYANHTFDSVVAGCDLEMPSPSRERGAKLVAAVRASEVAADAVRACAERVLKLAARLGRFQDPVLAQERADDLPEHRALIRRLGADGAVLLKNEAPVGDSGGTPALPLALRAGQTVALIGRAATEAQAMGGGSATVNAHHRIAPADALRAAHPDVTFVTVPGADLFRYTPVLQQPMTVEFFDNQDLGGAAVLTEVSPNTEALWNDRTPPGLTWGTFSARARFDYVAEADGQHQFSLISAGPARLRLNGSEVLDGWTDWRRGDTYFTFGSDEIVHQRAMRAGERLSVEIDYTTARAEKTFYGLRVGAARLLDETDLAAAVDAARGADVAIVFAGLNAEWDNEGLDRPGLDLPHRQNALVARVAAANPRSVVVLQSGSPLLLPWLADVPAVLQAWYPGQECGHSIADVLIGAAEPGGRLPQTWPLRLEDTVAFGDAAQYPAVDGEVTYGEGVFIGYRHHEAHGIAPRFPFGFGLSYTSFAIEGLTLDRATLQPGETLTATVSVRNTGRRAGSEVVQLYVHDAASTKARPPQELKAFAKLTLQPGEAQAVSLSLGMRAFAAFDEARAAWVAEAGAFEVRVGRSSADLPLRAALTLAADWVDAA